MAEFKQEARDFARDSFREDMAAHQRLTGQMPTTRENDELLSVTLEAIENRRARRKAAPDSPADVPEVRQSDKNAEKLGYKILRGADDDGDEIVKPLNPLERQLAERMQARVALLLSKRDRGSLNAPSWCERVMAALRTIGWHKERQQHPGPGYAELFAVFEDSIAVFGDWKADPAKPLHVDYGAHIAKLKGQG